MNDINPENIEGQKEIETEIKKQYALFKEYKSQ